MNLTRKLTKIEREQLKQDCKELQRRNETPEQKLNHDTNGLRQYAKLYVKYRKYFPKKEAKTLAKWVYQNQLKGGTK